MGKKGSNMPAKFADIKPKRRVCEECGITFTPYHYRQQTCSDVCANNRFIHRYKKPSKSIGSFLNETSFNKAWKEAKKDLESLHNENTKVHSWIPPKKIDDGETNFEEYVNYIKRLEKI